MLESIFWLEECSTTTDYYANIKSIFSNKTVFCKLIYHDCF